MEKLAFSEQTTTNLLWERIETEWIWYTFWNCARLRDIVPELRKIAPELHPPNSTIFCDHVGFLASKG